jgi:glycosyltransferase involved in cell wall biosynthesis
MKIAYVTAGAAGMYCGSCIHDNTLATALIRNGHDVTLLPTYTPPRTDEPSVSLDDVFYGAVNVYLEEKSSFFRRGHPLLDWLLNRPALLSWVGSFSSATSGKDLGALTVSILKGETGHQQKELDRLVRWLHSNLKPDLVHLANSMFLGMARELRSKLGVPVLCSLQGEDIFLEELEEPYKTEAKDLIRERAADVAGFVAPSRVYADFMSDYVGIDRQKIHVVPLGLNLEGHGQNDRRNEKGPVRIGYLARICPEKGLHVLVEAFDLLVQRLGSEGLALETAGYLGPQNRDYFDRIQRRISESSWAGQFRNWGEVDRKEKIAFFSSLDILSVPTPYKDPKGLFVLEALANGAAVVQPAHGSFPELIETTGGGLLVEPDSVEALADGLQLLVEDREKRIQMAASGKASVFREYDDETLAENALAVYRQYVPA